MTLRNLNYCGLQHWNRNADCSEAKSWAFFLCSVNINSHRLILETSVSLLCVITKLHIAGWLLGKVEASRAIFSQSAKVPVNIYLSVSFRSCLLVWWFGEHSRSVGSCGPFLKRVAQTFKYCNALQYGWCFVLMAVDYLKKNNKNESLYKLYLILHILLMKLLKYTEIYKNNLS